VPAAAFVVLLGFMRLLRRRELRRAVVTGLAAIGTFLLLVGAWKLVVASQSRPAYGQVSGAASGVRDLREFASYLWQYYLPQLPFQNHVRFSNATISDYPAFGVWIATGWAAFGWVTVYFPKGPYWLFLAITVAIGLGALAAGLRWLRPNWRSTVLRSTALPVGVFYALATGVLLLGLHLAEYQLHTPVNQGRYLFPLAGLAAAMVVAALTWLPERLRMRAVATVLGLLVVWQLFTLGLVASRYYA
jgi:fluoride ion exporter CrcB/FEX